MQRPLIIGILVAGLSSVGFSDGFVVKVRPDGVFLRSNEEPYWPGQYIAIMRGRRYVAKVKVAKIGRRATDAFAQVENGTPRSNDQALTVAEFTAARGGAVRPRTVNHPPLGTYEPSTNSYQTFRWGLFALGGLDYDLGKSEVTNASGTISVSPKFGGFGFGVGVSGEYFLAAAHALEFDLIWTHRSYNYDLSVTGAGSVSGQSTITMQQVEFPLIYNWYINPYVQPLWSLGIGLLPRFGFGSVQVKFTEVNNSLSYGDAGITTFAVRPVIQGGIQFGNHDSSVQFFTKLRIHGALLRESTGNYGDSGSYLPIHFDLITGVSF